MSQGVAIWREGLAHQRTAGKLLNVGDTVDAMVLGTKVEVHALLAELEALASGER